MDNTSLELDIIDVLQLILYNMYLCLYSVLCLLLRREGGIILLIATCILHETNSSVVVIVFMFIYVWTTV